jgi:hypothetical protein
MKIFISAFGLFSVAFGVATEAVSLLQLASAKTTLTCKEQKKAWRDARNEAKELKAILKAARISLSTAKTQFAAAKAAAFAAKNAMDEACPAPESDGHFIPSCRTEDDDQTYTFAKGLVKEKELNLEWNYAKILSADVGKVSEASTPQQCASDAYNGPFCREAAFVIHWDAMKSGQSGYRCFCDTGARFERSFLTESDFQAEGYPHNPSALANFQKIAGEVSVCYMDKKKKNDFSLNYQIPNDPNIRYQTRDCSTDPNSWKSYYAQEPDDDTRFTLGRYDKNTCVVLAQQNPKCKLATRVSTVGGCSCEWGPLTANVNPAGRILPGAPGYDWMIQVWGTQTCRIPKTPFQSR